MNYGYKPSVIDDTHYVFGASQVPFIVRREDGNWFASRPSKEIQHTSFDTYNCTGFNTLAQIEAYMKEVFGLTVNYSDRFLGIVAGTRPPGNDPQTVYEAIRKHGLIPDEMLPLTSDITSTEEYYSFKGADEKACREAGKKWLEEWDFKHEWVTSSGYKLAFKASPIARAVYAWAMDDRGIYVRLGDDTHWTFAYAHDLYDKVEDSYEPTLKDVDQDVRFAKRIYITKRTTPVTQNWLIDTLKKLLALVKPRRVPDPIPVSTVPEKPPRERLYEAAFACLGTDASPKDVAPDDRGCAESVNAIYFEAFGEYIETPGISTLKLFGAMVDQPHKFARVTEPEPGNIIISPTGFGNGVIKHGHVGIFGKNGIIMSSNSSTGKFEENYTLDTWVERYRNKGLYPIYYFKCI